MTAELIPTAIRARAQGLTHNVGRVASAIAPLVVGSLAESRGFGFCVSGDVVRVCVRGGDVDRDS